VLSAAQTDILQCGDKMIIRLDNAARRAWARVQGSRDPERHRPLTADLRMWGSCQSRNVLSSLLMSTLRVQLRTDTFVHRPSFLAFVHSASFNSTNHTRWRRQSLPSRQQRLQYRLQAAPLLHPQNPMTSTSRLRTTMTTTISSGHTLKSHIERGGKRSSKHTLR